MTETQVKLRSEIPPEFTWNAPSVFPTPEDWYEEAKKVEAELPRLAQLRGRIAEGPAALLEVGETVQEFIKRVYKLIVYASLAHQVDTEDQDAGRMYGQAVGLFGKVYAAISFFDPELLATGQETLLGWIDQEPRLETYRHYINDLFRKQAHVRSAEIEEILGMLQTPFSGAENTAAQLTDADFRFKPAVTSDGKEIPVTQGTIEEILAGPDREARKTAWNNYMDTYLAFKNTLASNLSTSINQNVFTARVRRYNSTLEASLFQNNIPVEVFHNLIETFKRHLPTWHRYWAIRRKALGLDELRPYDIWAPLTSQKSKISYLQAVEMICEGLAPMGEEYVNRVRKGCLEDRWVDVYPTKGKSSSQFSTGAPGTHPFICINYDDTIFSLSTLAHELGHSMHSYLTWQNQPVLYSDYSLFAAEVASNFHQAMVRAHLLNTSSDPAFQISVIEEAMSNFHRYFFIMPTLARFELETHQRAERGEGLTADDMIELMADLFAEGYGTELTIGEGRDRERTGITWATFGHLYADYYVYQYTTGISGANALARRILAGEPGAVDRYLTFLKAGSSVYPLDALKQAGVDLSTPKPIEETFAILGGLVDRLEQLTAV
ncbi:MAG: oligoendopeptidase F [Chloroflexi bacterium]|nr:oligoendopeptidase F [Chloroflexota bacterium]